MKTKERVICPRCGRIQLVREKDYANLTFTEICASCGFATEGTFFSDSLVTKKKFEGYGVISYTNSATLELEVIPLDNPQSQNAARRDFKEFLNTHAGKYVEGTPKLTRFDERTNSLEEYDQDKDQWGRCIPAATNEDGKKRWADDYVIQTKREEVLLAEIDEMELQSRWIPGVVSRKLRVIPVPSPIEAMGVCVKYNLDPDQTYENAFSGLKLILNNEGTYYNVSDSSRVSLYETAKLFGSSLSKLAPEPLAQTLNNSLAIAPGTTLLLIRYGKVMAMPSGNYCIMPISELLNITKRELSKFGTMTFEEGFTSNTYTAATWSLPDAQSDLIAKYQDALQAAPSRTHAINFMPMVRLEASDTARRAASLRPLFRMGNGTEFPIGNAISVVHEIRGKGKYGLDLFEQEAGTVFAKFYESMETMERMAKVEIYNPVNTCVGIFNWLNKASCLIPRKYADEVREEIERAAINTPIMSMHDIYLYMAECIGIAKQSGASLNTRLRIEEGIAKILTLDWAQFDVGGLVAWGDKKPI